MRPLDCSRGSTWHKRVLELEAEGLTTSDAQSVADVEADRATVTTTCEDLRIFAGWTVLRCDRAATFRVRLELDGSTRHVCRYCVRGWRKRRDATIERVQP